MPMHLGVRLKLGSGLTTDLSHTRPADVLVLNWERGKHAAFDIMVISPLIPSIQQQQACLKGLQQRRLRSESIKSMTLIVGAALGAYNIPNYPYMYICTFAMYVYTEHHALISQV